jgi:integrase
LTAFKTFISYHSLDIDIDKFKSQNKIEARLGKDLSDEEIIQGWENLKNYQSSTGRKSKYQKLFAWMYGMMAVYGLRNHEVLNIQNLTQPFKMPNSNIILPAFNDPNNKDKAIYTHGKTGERVQPMPLPKEWIKLFQLEDVPEFPVFENLKQKDNFLANFINYCVGDQYTKKDGTIKINYVKKIDFTLYNLRHTYAIRLRKNGVNPLDAKDYCGHSLLMHEKIYNKGIKTSTLIESAQKYQEKIAQNPELSEIEKLRIENQELKEQNNQLAQQNKELNSKIELLLEKLSEKQ